MASDVSTATLTAGGHVPHTKSCRKTLTPGIPRVTPSMTSDDVSDVQSATELVLSPSFKDGDPTRPARQLRAPPTTPALGSGQPEADRRVT